MQELFLEKIFEVRTYIRLLMKVYYSSPDGVSGPSCPYQSQGFNEPCCVPGSQEAV